MEKWPCLTRNSIRSRRNRTTFRHLSRPPQETPGLTISVTIELKLDLHLPRKQKHALIGLYEGATVTFVQEDAAEGMLNLLDFLQDSILEQDLAAEDGIFPKLPQLFDKLPVSSSALV
jgi:hypothetical protein